MNSPVEPDANTISFSGRPPGIAFVDADLSLCDADGRFLALLGADSSIIGTSAGLLLPHARPSLAELVDASRASRHPQVDVQLTDALSGQRWLLSLSPLFSRVGRYLGVDLLLSELIGVAPDGPLDDEALAVSVSHRRYTFSHADGPLRAVFEQANIGIVLTGPNGGLIDANPGFCSIVGYTIDELRQVQPQQLTHPEDLAHDRDQMARVVQGQPADPIEKRYIHKSGATVWVRVSRGLVHDTSGALQFGLLIVQDITATKAAEEALRASEGMLRRLAEHATVGLLVGERAGAIRYVNPALRTMLGYATADFPTSWRDLTPPEYLDRDSDAMRQLQQCGVCAPYEKAYRDKDGRHVPVLVGASMIERFSIHNGLAAVFITDLSPLRRAEQALAESYAAEQQIRRAAEHAASRAERLFVLTAALSRALTPEGIARVFVSSSVTATIGAVMGVLMLIDHDQATLRLVDSEGLAQATRMAWRQLPLAMATPLSDAFRRNEPVWLENRAARAARYPDLDRDYPTETEQAWAALPLALGPEVFGVFGLTFDVGQRFDADERTFLTTVASLCAQALERARLMEAERIALAAADEARALLDTLIDSAPIGLAFLDVDLRYRRVNSALAAINGLPAAAHLNRYARDLFPTLAPLWEEHWRQILESGAPVVDLELRSPTSSTLGAPGRDDENATEQSFPMRYGLASYYPVRSASGELLGVGAVVQDITERKLVEQERVQLLEATQAAQRAEYIARARAEEALRLRDAFLSVAAHELKNPLTAVLGQADLLKRRLVRGGLLDGANQRSLDIVISQSRRLNQLITNMLDSARVESGQLTLARHSLDLSRLLHSVLSEAQVLLANHELHEQIGSEVLLINGDALRLEQVFQNLLSNAAKYSPPGTVVEVRLERLGVHAVVSVRDAGIGIPAEALPLLFERFYRAPNSLTSQVNGSGVGLYVVREIVGLHGGDVAVESELNVGSIFTVRLPILDGPALQVPVSLTLQSGEQDG